MMKRQGTNGYLNTNFFLSKVVKNLIFKNYIFFAMQQAEEGRESIDSVCKRGVIITTRVSKTLTVRLRKTV